MKDYYRECFRPEGSHAYKRRFGQRVIKNSYCLQDSEYYIVHTTVKAPDLISRGISKRIRIIIISIEKKITIAE